MGELGNGSRRAGMCGRETRAQQSTDISTDISSPANSLLDQRFRDIEQFSRLTGFDYLPENHENDVWRFLLS